MTPTEKAQETGKTNKEKQKAKAEERDQILQAMKRTCLEVLDDHSIPASDKIDALRILNDMRKGW